MSCAIRSELDARPTETLDRQRCTALAPGIQWWQSAVILTDALRQRLDEITENGNPESHPDLIAQLRQYVPHAIEVVPSPAPISRYTCVVHALNLVENKEYEEIVLASPKHVFASPAFVDRLISRQVLAPAPCKCSGSLVLYRQGGRLKHIGKMVLADNVESKWGVGHLYRHPMLEVPAKYGCETEFVDAIDADVAIDELVVWARENGVRFEGDV